MILAVSGELDLCTAPGLTHALARASRMGDELIVDLEDVAFMDCSGLRVLMRWAGEEDGRGPRVVAVTPGPPQVQRLFELTGAGRIIPVISPESVEDTQAA